MKATDMSLTQFYRALLRSKSLFPLFLVVLSCCTFLFPVRCMGQQARYELGKQVIGFEEAFDNNLENDATRKAVLPELQAAVQSFFAMSLSGAEKSIDSARIKLAPSQDQVWLKAAVPVRLRLEKHWLAKGNSSAKLELVNGYKPQEEQALPWTTTFSLLDATGNSVRQLSESIPSLPGSFEIMVGDLPEGDYILRAELTGTKEGEKFTLPTQTISISNDLDSRLNRINEQLEQRAGDAQSTALRTAKFNRGILRDLARGRVLETDYPANRLLTQTELWLQSLASTEQPAMQLSPGEHWLELVNAKKYGIVRVSVPTNYDDKKPLRIVVAYHGAGGSENMFFDAYGAGKIVDLCQSEKCLLVAPRQPLLGGTLALSQMIEELEKHVSIDRTQIDLIGHSMGAAQVISQVEGSPNIARSAVILGGGGGVSRENAWKNIRVFAAAGEADFGKRGADAFARSVKRFQPQVISKTYAGIEHLGIVQAALTDVFQWLKQDSSVKVMSFNIRYGTANDGENRWESRKEFLVQTIRNFNPDLLGTQETLGFQRDYLQEQFPDYASLGVGRDDGKEQGEMMALYYRKSRFTLIRSGHFWLSETPEVVGSKSWDSSLPRMATWVELRDNNHPESASILFVNTHFDHRGNVAREESAKLIRRKLQTEFPSSKLIVTGDFNASVNSKPYEALFGKLEEKESPLLDTFRAKHASGEIPEGTFSGFKALATQGDRIDWIGCSRDWDIVAAEIDRTEKDGRTPSDHFPVTAILGLKPQ